MAEQVSGRRQFKYKTGQSVSGENEMKSSKASVYVSSAEDKVCTKTSGNRSVYKSSEEFYEFNCDPCKSFNEYHEAEGFCTVCKEYLCSTCFRSHSRNKVSKHHTLLAKDDMPRKSSKLCNPCIIAGDEILAVGYCRDCSDFLCHDCFKSHPRNKLSREHVLEKQEQIEDTEQAVTTAFHQMNTKEGINSCIHMEEEYIYVRDINVKSNTDEKDCLITDMTTVSTNDLVIVDTLNKCLKLVDIERNVIKGVLSLQSYPLGITAINDEQVAVTLANIQQIKIISLNENMKVDRTIKTSGLCEDVKMINRRLYVSYSSPLKFQILKSTGKVIKTIKPDGEVLKHCTSPRYIAVTPDESIIYVSDWETHTLVSLGTNGNMLALYPNELENPYGITILPSGSIVLCNRGQRCVIKVTSDLDESTVILGPGDGLEHPQALCLNTTNKHLYISSASPTAKYLNAIKVFKY